MIDVAVVLTPESSWEPATSSQSPSQLPRVGLVFADGSTLTWAAEEPAARPFIAIADVLLASRTSPEWPMVRP